MNKYLDRILILLPTAFFLFDIIFLASGNWSSNFGIPFRKILFIYLSGFSILIFFSRGLLKLNHCIYLILLMVFIVIWVFLVPLANGIDIYNSISDGQLFIGLLLIPFFGFMFVNYLRDYRYINFLFYLLLFLAIFHIGLYLISLWNLDVFFSVVDFLKRKLEPGVDDQNTSIYMGVVDGRVRVFFGGSIFLLMLFHMCFVRYINTGGSKIFLLITLFAIYCTSTRSMLIAIFLYLIYYFSLKFFSRGNIDSLKIFFFSLIIVLQTIPILMMADPYILSVIGLGRDISDDIRYEQMEVLRSMLLTNPLIGNGLGASASIIRSENAPWSYELSIFALYMKVGVFGVTLLLLSMFFLLDRLIKHTNETKWNYAALGALILAYNFCSNTNPFIFSFAGVVFITYFYVEYLKISSDR